MKLTYGSIRPLLIDELCLLPAQRQYRLVVVKPYVYEENDKKIVIPSGFLTDGATGIPDIGKSWLFHDYLYSSHQYTSGQKCTRKEADALMCKIAEYEGWKPLSVVCRAFFSFNIFYVATYAWRNSRKDGPEFLQDYSRELFETRILPHLK